MSRVLIAALVITLGLAAHVDAAQDAARSTPAVSAPLNLNTATVAQLEALPGIGRATAERIVEYRQKSGGFKKAEEILETNRSGPYSLNNSSSPIADTVSKGRQKSQ